MLLFIYLNIFFFECSIPSFITFFGKELYSESSCRFMSVGVYGSSSYGGLPSIRSFQNAVTLGLWFSSKSYSYKSSFLEVLTNNMSLLSGDLLLSARWLEEALLLVRIFFSLYFCFFSDVYYKFFAFLVLLLLVLLNT